MARPERLNRREWHRLALTTAASAFLTASGSARAGARPPRGACFMWPCRGSAITWNMAAMGSWSTMSRQVTSC